MSRAKEFSYLRKKRARKKLKNCATLGLEKMPLFNKKPTKAGSPTNGTASVVNGHEQIMSQQIVPSPMKQPPAVPPQLGGNRIF